MVTIKEVSMSESRKLTAMLGTHGHDDRRSLIINHGKLKSAMTITFERTVRVPDSTTTNSLPPSLGQFPLFNVSSYPNTMPESMLQKGGLFLPMYQKEAMWLNFSSQEPFALKIYVGGVNAISGIPINESPAAALKRLSVASEKAKSKQDYVILPDQPWLDGIASEDGAIRQFVAMPKGSGHSVELQVTGEEKLGGIQFEIIPVKRVLPSTLTISYTAPPQTRTNSKTVTWNLPSKGLTDSSTIKDLKTLIRGEFDIEVEHQVLTFTQASNYGTSGRTTTPNLWDYSVRFDEMHFPDNATLTLTDSSYIAPRQGDITLSRRSGGAVLGGAMPFMAAAPPPPPPPPSFGSSAPKMYSIMSSSFAAAPASEDDDEDGSMDYAMAEGGSFGMSAAPPEPGAAMMDASSLKCGAAPAPMKKMGSPFSSTRNRETKAKAKPVAKAPQVKAMSLAAGGLIKQSINEDTYPASIWDTEATIFINVQLLNSESFLAVTGKLPPDCPIDAKTYQSYGYPFYDIWNEEVNDIKGAFEGVKSIAMIDEEKSKVPTTGTAGKGAFWEQVAGEGEGKEEVSKTEFVGEEHVQFPVVMLDAGGRKTFKPLEVLKAEAK